MRPADPQSLNHLFIPSFKKGFKINYYKLIAKVTFVFSPSITNIVKVKIKSVSLTTLFNVRKLQEACPPSLLSKTH